MDVNSKEIKTEMRLEYIFTIKHQHRLFISLFIYLFIYLSIYLFIYHLFMRVHLEHVLRCTGFENRVYYLHIQVRVRVVITCC